MASLNSSNGGWLRHDTNDIWAQLRRTIDGAEEKKLLGKTWGLGVRDHANEIESKEGKEEKTENEKGFASDNKKRVIWSFYK